jgi:hypothetical protein
MLSQFCKSINSNSSHFSYIYTFISQSLSKGRDSSVGIATTGWTVRGSKQGGGEIFRTRQDWPWVPHSLLHNGYRVSFSGVKRLGHDANHTPAYGVCSRTKFTLLHQSLSTIHVSCSFSSKFAPFSYSSAHRIIITFHILNHLKR